MTARADRHIVAEMGEKPAFSERRAGPDDSGRRLDRVLRSCLGELPLSAIYGALRRGRILLNGRRAEGAARVEEGDLISFDPRLLPRDGIEVEAAAATASGDAAWSGVDALAGLLALATADLLFMNKPRGMLVHGEDSLEDRVREALRERSRGSLSFNPGPLHRLDRNTSGLVVFPRSAAGARAFTALVRERRVEKRYLALLDGVLEGEEAWRDRIERDGGRRSSSVGEAGRPASAIARPLLAAGGRSLALVLLGTGLTHQIRVQAAARGLPLAGDSKYGGRPFPGGYLLHAYALRFPEPPFPDCPDLVVAPPPPGARRRLEGIFGVEALEKALETAVEA